MATTATAARARCARRGRNRPPPRPRSRVWVRRTPDRATPAEDHEAGVFHVQRGSAQEARSEIGMETMEISAAMVKKLRDLTGAGMMECKAALTEAHGDIEAATTILRKRGLASATKKAGRSTNEGLI